ncbi:MAG: His/Gly/Thr/Pro-type tRNA ligase C-terminal domain-containing protein, partial [Oscillospiraceae bacterium]
IERLMLLMEAQKSEFPERKKCDLFIASMGENANIKAAAIANDLRNEGISVQFDTASRSVKAQMKFANKIGAAYTMVIGDSELENGIIKIKNMADGIEKEINLSNFTDEFQSEIIRQAMSGFESLGLDDIDISNILGGLS